MKRLFLGSILLMSCIAITPTFAAQTYISLQPTMVNGNIVTEKDVICDNQKDEYKFTITPQSSTTLKGVVVTIDGEYNLINHLKASLTIPGSVAELDFGYTPVTSNTTTITFSDTYINQGSSLDITITPVIPCSGEGIYTLSLTDIVADGNHELIIEDNHLFEVTSSLRSLQYNTYDTDIRSVVFTDSNVMIKSCLDPQMITAPEDYPTSILHAINTDTGLAVETVINRSNSGAGCRDTLIPLIALGAGASGETFDFQFFLDRDPSNTVYETVIENNKKELQHTTSTLSTSNNPVELIRTSDVKTLGGVIGLSLCNNDTAIELPGSNNTIDVIIDNKINRTTLTKSVQLPKTLSQGSCTYVYVHRRELGTINEGTYKMYLDIDAGSLSDLFITQKSEVNITILNAEKDVLATRQDYSLGEFFIKDNELTFSVCNEGGKTILERTPTIGLYRGTIADVATDKSMYDYPLPLSLATDQCQQSSLLLDLLPDSIFVGGNKQITLAVIDEIDEYDFGNNLIQFEATQYEREGITSPLELEEKAVNWNPSTQDLITRMYNQGLTKYNTVEEFEPDRLITRGEIAKFFTQFAALLDMQIVKSNDQCQFKDITGYDETLTPHITRACKLGIIQGFDGRYSPQNNLLLAEGLTVAMRALDGNKDETSTPWWTNYYKYAFSLDIISLDSPRLLDADADRKTIGLRLYRAANTTPPEIVSPTGKPVPNAPVLSQ